MFGAYCFHSELLSPLPTNLHTSLRRSVNDGGMLTAGHFRTVLSCPPETRNCPLLANATLSTERRWPASGSPSSVPLLTSHSRISESLLPEASVFPSGLNATLRT